jgi:GTPase SAR1 family protein
VGKYFKKITGKRYEDVYGRPTYDSIVEGMWKKTDYPLRTLGTHDGTPFRLSEEERTHTHIIGTTNVGKSTLMQLLIREDIDRGNALCLIDSSDSGDTAYKVLAYCAKKKAKVLLIDPQHFGTYKKYVPINPFGRYPEESAQKILDTIMIQFQQSDFSATPVIKQYLPAIIRVLHKAGRTFPDALYFTEPVYVRQRETIFSKLPENDHDVLMLSRVFSDRDVNREFRPTARRLSDLLNPILRTMFNTREGIDFRKLVTEKWVVICNLYADGMFGTSHARFLGTTILNEYTRAVDQIRKHGWRGRYYLYVDEAGLYANRNVADNLSYKGKTGLQMILANQYLGQFEDPYVRQAVLNQTGIKIVFRPEDEADQKKLAAMLYGGQVKDRDAAFYFSRLHKRQCVIKLPAQDPVRMTVSEVRDIKLNPDYIEKLYQDPIYETTDIKRPARRAQPDDRPAPPPPRRETKHSPKSPKESPPKRAAGKTKEVRGVDAVFLEIEKLKRAK